MNAACIMKGQNNIETLTGLETMLSYQQISFNATEILEINLPVFLITTIH